MWGHPGLRLAFLGLVALIALCARRYPLERLDPAPLLSTRIVDRHGRLLYEQRSARGGYGRWTPLDQISPSLLLATLSAEDAGFWAHPGIDPVGVGRAVWLNARERRIAYGGSTITQQLAGLLEPRPRTVLGKIGEARDALRLEATLSKQQLLEQYLNRAHYGRLTTGVGAASWRFFGKRATDLTLDEAALLAILPRAPSAYDPDRFPERARRRRAHVLATLARRGWIDAAAARAAAAAPLRLVDPAQLPRARHVLDALPQSGRSGPELVTTIDLELQLGVERRVREHLAALGARDVDQAAVVVLDNATGDVLAMTGSRAYDEPGQAGAVNAALAPRPPGSTLKPFVYALAFERGAGPSTLAHDVPSFWPGFHPRNARLDYRGRVPLREALGSSLNVPAVRLADRLGVRRVASTLAALGLGTSSELERHGLALALGSAPVRLVDLAAAYATLARDGLSARWHLVDPGLSPPAPRVLSAQAARQVTAVLSDAGARRREFGVETPLELPFEAAAKTGTSRSFCDNFAVGYTPEVTVAVWVGNFDGRPMQGLLAMQGAAPLWREVMLLAMRDRPRRAFPPPSAAPLRRAADALPPLEITSPAAGARFTIDALLPRSRQVLRLRALVHVPGAPRVRWQVDGRAIESADDSFSADWPLQPGRHRVRASVLARGRELGAREIEIDVDGGTT